MKNKIVIKIFAYIWITFFLSACSDSILAPSNNDTLASQTSKDGRLTRTRVTQPHHRSPLNRNFAPADQTHSSQVDHIEQRIENNHHTGMADPSTHFSTPTQDTLANGRIEITLPSQQSNDLSTPEEEFIIPIESQFFTVHNRLKRSLVTITHGNTTKVLPANDCVDLSENIVQVSITAGNKILCGPQRTACEKKDYSIKRRLRVRLADLKEEMLNCPRFTELASL